MNSHPRLWWFKLLSYLFPSRCREIPLATDPDTILIRQFAIIKQRAYLQQFANSEELGFYHTHPWAGGTIAIGLSGSVGDLTPVGSKIYRAPYFRYMSASHVHATRCPSKRHTSIFIGLGEKTDNKFYIAQGGPWIHWRNRIKKLVARI